MEKIKLSKGLKKIIYDIEEYEINTFDKKYSSMRKDIKKIISSLNEIIENKHIRYQQLLKNLAIELDYDRAFILSFSTNINSIQENYEFTKENIKSNAEQIKNLKLSKFSFLIEILKRNKFVYISDINNLDKNLDNYNYFIDIADQFFVKSVLFFPIFDKNEKLTGIIGLSNQNKVNKLEKPDIIYLSYILSIIKNFVGINFLEDKYEAVFNNTNFAIILLNQDGLIIEGNKKIEEISGYKKEEVVNKKYFQEFIIKSELDRIESFFKHRESTKDIPNKYTTKIKSKDRGIRDVSISVSMIKDRKLRIVAVNDITERIKKEKKLKEINRRYFSLFKNNSSIMLLINPNNGKIEDANQAAVNFYGYSYDKLISMKIQEINTLTEKEVKIEIKKADTNSKRYFKFKHLISTGEIKEVEVYSGPIIVNEKRILYSIIHDISEKKEIKERWQAEKKFNKALINTAQAIIMTTNKDLITTSVNDHIEELTGYKKDEIKGKDSIDLITAPKDKAGIYDLFTEIFKGNKDNVYSENEI
ncbi:MAG: PAS domain S-box protein, partial [Halanaerobiales bacterium]|nr:PAS domain S-box protein [Halanaerobiales bacterium]